MRDGSKLGQQRSVLLVSRARILRSRLTPSEKKLWNELRAGKLGVVFRRQVLVGGRFIADFLAVGRRVVVEVDGGWHHDRRAADARRDRLLARLGYRVVRVEAGLVETNLEGALALIRASLGVPR